MASTLWYLLAIIEVVALVLIVILPRSLLVSLLGETISQTIRDIMLVTTCQPIYNWLHEWAEWLGLWEPPKHCITQFRASKMWEDYVRSN